MNIKIKKLNCKRCDHKWVPRRTDIRQCPSCKSAYWNKRNDKKIKE